MALIHHDINPQVYFTDVAGPFVVYMQISMICAAVLASPWLLYQLWLFVAAGLYAKERKLITKYLPLSIGLLLAGVIVLYFLVLPLYHGNPPPPLAEGQMWVDQDLRRLKVFFGGQPRVINFMPANLVAPLITLPEYIDMVINLLVAFALSFQTPLVVMALVRAGIVEIGFLRSMRKYVYFIISVIAAFIIPDVATGWIMLMIPLFGLYELGLWLASRPVTPYEDPS